MFSDSSAYLLAGALMVFHRQKLEQSQTQRYQSVFLIMPHICHYLPIMKARQWHDTELQLRLDVMLHHYVLDRDDARANSS